MKKVISLVLCAVLIVISSGSVNAVDISKSEIDVVPEKRGLQASCIVNSDISNSDIDVVSEKRELRASCIANDVRSKVQTMEPQEREAKKQDIYTTFFSGEMDVDIAVSKLEELGVYALQSSIDEYKRVRDEQRTSPTVLSYNNVVVYYDSWDDTWELGAGVWWSDNSWIADVPVPLIPSVGRVCNVGGLNGVGITLYDLSGSFAGCALEDTWLFVSAGEGKLSTTTHSPTGNVDSRYGVFHQFQDYAQVVDASAFTSTYIYYGKHMSVFAKYNSEFENFHGRARLQYVHTWNQTSISSVKVNFGGGSDSVEAGFEIGFTEKTHQFETFSPRETLF